MGDICCVLLLLWDFPPGCSESADIPPRPIMPKITVFSFLFVLFLSFGVVEQLVLGGEMSEGGCEVSQVCNEHWETVVSFFVALGSFLFQVVRNLQTYHPDLLCPK